MFYLTCFSKFLNSFTSSIVIEGIRTLFSQIKKSNNNTNPTFNKPKKEFSTLNNQLSTKKFSEGGKFIINRVINKTLKNCNIL